MVVDSKSDNQSDCIRNVSSFCVGMMAQFYRQILILGGG